MALRTAVIVRMPLPARLARIRDARDGMAARGVPPHVTILFPWLSATALNEDVRAALADAVINAKRFRSRVDRVDRRDRMVWLIPAEQGPFLGLTAAVAARWPETPPYGGVHPDLIAHVTLLEHDDPVALRDAARVATGLGPFDIPVDAIEVIAEDNDGRWRDVWKIDLPA